MSTKETQPESQMLEAMLQSLYQGNPKKDGEADKFFKKFSKTARIYFVNMQRLIQEKLEDDTSKQQQLVLVKIVKQLIEEWQRVKPIYNYLLQDESNKDKSTNESEIIEHIQAIFKVAQEIMVIPSVTGSNDRKLSDIIDLEVIPRFDVSFSMLRVPYYPNKVLLSIPAYAMLFTDAQKIIWHELASLIVNPENTVTLLQSKSIPNHLPHELFQRLSHPVEDIDWKTYNNKPYKLSKRYKAGKSEAGGWKYFWMYWAKELFSQKYNLEIHAVPFKDEFPEKRNYLADWRRAHLEELVEDACSTLVFGAETYRTFLTVFERFYNGDLEKPDMRHPSPEFRLEVTYQLLVLMGEEAEISKALQSPQGEEIAKDPLATQHGKLPGAKEIAKWIHTNRLKLINDCDLPEIRTRLKEAGTELENKFYEQRQTSASDQPDNEQQQTDTSDQLDKEQRAESAQTPEELELLLFSWIDPNLGSSHANITSDEIIILVPGEPVFDPH